jgi:hypothetical protein
LPSRFVAARASSAQPSRRSTRPVRPWWGEGTGPRPASTGGASACIIDLTASKCRTYNQAMSGRRGRGTARHDAELAIMAQPSFDPSEAITFDLAYGHVHLDGAPNRILVPSDALLELCDAAGEDAVFALGHAMGTAIGRRVSVRLASTFEDRQAVVADTPFELVVEHLAGEVALLGLGALGAEQSPFGDRGDGLLTEVLQAALQVLSGQPARVVALERSGARGRFVVVAAESVEAVRSELGAGQSWGAILAKLHPAEPPV